MNDVRNVVKNSLCEGNRPTEIGASLHLLVAAAKLSVKPSAAVARPGI